VWEATAITIAAAAISRLRSTLGLEQAWLRCREYCHGRQWDPVKKQISQVQGALDGSINQWINVLFEIAKLEGTVGFLSAPKARLRADAAVPREVTCETSTDHPG
jgi:hypothetical protein